MDAKKIIIPPVEVKYNVVLTITEAEAKEFMRLIGATSMFEREKFFKEATGFTPVKFNFPSWRADDILGIIYRHVYNAIESKGE